MSVRSDLGGYELGLLLEARVSGNGKKKKDATPSDLHVGTSPRSETRCERFHPRPPAWHGEARLSMYIWIYCDSRWREDPKHPEKVAEGREGGPRVLETS